MYKVYDNKLFAKSDLPKNQDILNHFDFKDLILKSNNSRSPNININFDEKTTFYKLITNKRIKKGDIISIDFRKINNLNCKKILQGGGLKYTNINSDLKDFSLILKDIMIFINNKNFNSNQIRDLKDKINKTKFFRSNKINNKDIYKIAKKMETGFNLQKGGNNQDGMTNNIEVLPDVEAPSFLHHPQSITMTQKINKLHIILDILGIIPGYGIAADTINFLLYFVRGEYSDALFSLICLIPTVGSLLGLTGKYIAKYFENSPPEYREYYKSMISLKDRTKEFQMIEDKNLDLDGIAYQDSDQEYSP